jgi:hypothetical protein
LAFLYYWSKQQEEPVSSGRRQGSVQSEARLVHFIDHELRRNAAMVPGEAARLMI